MFIGVFCRAVLHRKKNLHTSNVPLQIMYLGGAITTHGRLTLTTKPVSLWGETTLQTKIEHILWAMSKLSTIFEKLYKHFNANCVRNSEIAIQIKENQPFFRVIDQNNILQSFINNLRTWSIEILKRL